MLVGHLFSNVDLSQRGAQDRAGAAHHAPAAASLCTGRSVTGWTIFRGSLCSEHHPVVSHTRCALSPPQAPSSSCSPRKSCPPRRRCEPSSQSGPSPSTRRALSGLSPHASHLCTLRVFFARARDAPNDVSLPPPSEPSRNLPLCEARSALWAPLPYFLARSAAETLLQATAAAAFGAACYCLVEASRPPPPSSPSSSRSSLSPLSSPSRTS